MIFRLSAKLNKKLKLPPPSSRPLQHNPFGDWSAHLFTADRTQYILVTNTLSLYSAVMFGRGVTDIDEFIKRTIFNLGELMTDDGYRFIYERDFLPETASISFASALNRSVTGSMNDLVHGAQVYLLDAEIAPYEVSSRLNETPMSYLGHGIPRDAFGRMRLTP